MGWIGFDFDGTIATHYPGQYGLGDPIPSMIELLKQYLAQGYEVRIVTARAASPGAVAAIRGWCHEYIGQMLDVTDRKDYDMLLLYDDRAIAVESNTGRTSGFRT
jgi:hypothetical protein